MQAAYYTRRGAAADVLQLGERPTPEPGPGQARVRIHVSAVNPSDTKSRDTWRGASQMTYPLVIPHQDGAGVIDAVGAGVDVSRIGERVWLYMAQRGQPHGTAAQFTVVPAHKAVPLPDNAGVADGASLGIPAMTAHYALSDRGPVTGQTVLVHGGAGAVGFYAVQLAKWGGAAQVIATVSRDEQARQADAAGADLIVNYKRDDVVAAVRRTTGREHGVDRFVDVAFGANQDVNLALAAPGAVISAYGSDAVPAPALRFYDFMQRDVSLRMLLIYEAPQSARDAAVRDISQLLATGRLRHQVGARFALQDIVAAHEALESGRTVGKVLLDVA
jgi:NADPH:quinone reductase